MVGLNVQISWSERWNSHQEQRSKNLISFCFEIKTVIYITLPFLIVSRTPQVFTVTLLWMLAGRKIRDGFGDLNYLNLHSKLTLKVNVDVHTIFAASTGAAKMGKVLEIKIIFFEMVFIFISINLKLYRQKNLFLLKIIFALHVVEIVH